MMRQPVGWRWGLWWSDGRKITSPSTSTKIKVLNMDFRRQQREHSPIHFDRTAVEKVKSFKFLGVHITDNLKWSTHIDSMVKKAQQRLFNFRRLKKNWLGT